MVYSYIHLANFKENFQAYNKQCNVTVSILALLLQQLPLAIYIKNTF